MKTSSNTGKNVEMYRKAYKKVLLFNERGAMIIPSKTYAHK